MHGQGQQVEVGDLVVTLHPGEVSVEMGPTAEILWRPHRTYTQSLLAAVPRA
jgi:ABC-type dipeptide/oligopeptide/nickel transport system ATPase component